MVWRNAVFFSPSFPDFNDLIFDDFNDMLRDHRGKQDDVPAQSWTLPLLTAHMSFSSLSLSLVLDPSCLSL